MEEPRPDHNKPTPGQVGKAFSLREGGRWRTDDATQDVGEPFAPKPVQSSEPGEEGRDSHRPDDGYR